MTDQRQLAAALNELALTRARERTAAAATDAALTRLRALLPVVEEPPADPDPERQFREAALDRGIAVTADDRVRLADAAKLVGRGDAYYLRDQLLDWEGTRAWEEAHDLPVLKKDRGRWLVHLGALAAWYRED